MTVQNMKQSGERFDQGNKFCKFVSFARAYHMCVLIYCSFGKDAQNIYRKLKRVSSSSKQAKKQCVLGSPISLPIPDGLLQWMVQDH